MLFILIQSKDDFFAIDAMDIHTVIPYLGLLRQEDDSVVGVVNYAGRKVAAIDLMKIWSGGYSRNLFSTRCVLAKLKADEIGGMLGIISEGITSCAEIEDSKIEDFLWECGDLRLSKAFEYRSDMYKIINPEDLYSLYMENILSLKLSSVGDGIA